MGTISEKLTYLNDTKGLLKDSINSLGGNITSQTTFRQYATELDSIYSRLPKVSGTGSILSLSPTLKGRLGSVLKGNTLQDGTPTPDNPVEIQSATGLQNITVCGKNLLDTQYFENGSIDGTTGQNVSAPYNARGNNYISVLPNTTYTISANTILTNLRVSEYTKDKTNIQRDVISSNKILTITTTANTYYLRWSLNYNNSTELTQQIIDSLDLQLEKGSATEYEPYQNQEYEINLGKNLLPYDLAKLKSINTGGTWEGNVYTLYGATYTYNEDGSLTLGGNATGLSYINLYSSNSKNLIGENTIYTYSKGITNTNISMAIYEYINNSWVSKKYVNTSSTTYTPSGEQTGQIIRILINNGTDLSTPITIFPMIEKGSEATSYSPYFTPIHLYENDQIIGTPNNWSIKHVMGEVVFDGTENDWGKSSNENVDRYYINTNLYKNDANSKCNYFVKGSYSNTNVGIWVNNVSVQLFFNFAEAGTTTLQDWKTWLSTHNLKLVQPLATPTTETITDTDLIEDLNNLYYAQSNNDTTNISVSGNLPMILSVSALKGDTQ